MTPKTPAPARLFVLLAREAPVGVILRRGPNQWTQMVHWDTKKNIFTSGQWFKGKVYNYRCDLSPDGSLMIYLAAKHYKRGVLPFNRNSWTAISKPPYYTALDLQPEGDTYAGGGLFINNHTVWYNNTSPAEGVWSRPNPSLKLVSRREIYYEQALYYKHLEADGWVAKEGEKPYQVNGSIVSAKLPCSWMKRSQRYTLTLVYNYQKVQYSIVENTTRQEVTLADVTWADFDQQKRLVLAKEGKLFSAAVVDSELSYTELADFNANTPEAIEAPDWAKKW